MPFLTQRITKEGRIMGTYMKFGDFKTANEDEAEIFEYSFRKVFDIVPEAENGRAKEYFPAAGLKDEDVNKFGKGPFCAFNVSYESASGVYFIKAGDEIIYLGSTGNMQKEFNSGFGKISESCCGINGQRTHCKINNAVLQYFNSGIDVSVYFFRTDNRNMIKRVIINRLGKSGISPRFNGRDIDSVDIK